MTKEQVEEEVQEAVEMDEEEGESAFKEFVHHQRVAIEELGKAIESLFPKDFRDHTRNAGQAFIDSFRSLFEAAKEDLEVMMKRGKSEEDEEEEAEAATKVKVEIE